MKVVGVPRPGAMANETILIVDDVPANLKLARVVLERAGYDVHTAVNAGDALMLLETLRPRLVLVDLELPDLDGLELARRLKRDPRLGAIAVVALTAHPAPGDEARARAAGCEGSIAKPFDIGALAAAVARYIKA